MLYIVNDKHQLLKREDAIQFGIPLFRWFVREKDRDREGWSFFATLRYLNISNLQPWYRGVIQYLHEGQKSALEIWIGNDGLGIIFPDLRFYRLGQDHAL